MLAHEAAALAVIAAAFAEPLTYTGAGLTDAAIAGVRSSGDLPGQFGARKTMFCIQRDQLPGKPAKDDAIVIDDEHWRVIQTSFASDVNEWQLYVDRGAA